MRKLFKKASSFALATIIALTATACNMFNNDNSENQATSSTNQKIESAVEKDKKSKLNKKDNKAEARKKAKAIAEKAKAKVEKNTVSNKKIEAEKLKAEQTIKRVERLTSQDLSKMSASELLKLLYALPQSQRHTESDGLVFDPAEISQDTGRGFVIPHGDHYHLIPYNTLSELELMTAKAVLAEKSSQASNSGTTKKVYPKDPLTKPGKSCTGPNCGTQNKPSEKQNNNHKQNQNNKQNNTHKGNSQIVFSPEEIRKAKAAGKYTTDDGYIFSPYDIIEDLGNGYMVPHMSHLHFIPKKDLSKAELEAAEAFWSGKGKTESRPQKENNKQNPTVPKKPNKPENPENSQAEKPNQERPNTPENNKPNKEETNARSLLMKLYALPVSQRYQESDGLVFDPQFAKEVKVAGKLIGYRIPHGNHEHVVMLSSLTELEIEATKAVLAEKAAGTAKNYPQDPYFEANGYGKLNPDWNKPDHKEESKPDEKENEKEKSLADLIPEPGKIKKAPKGMDGKAYDTDDGYVFTVESITSVTTDGLITEHHGHSHYVPFNEMEDSELIAAKKYVKENLDKVSDQTKTELSEEEIQARLDMASLINAIPKKDLILKGNMLIVPHGDHSHSRDIRDYKLVYKMSDFEDEDEYESHVITFKMNKVKQKYDFDPKVEVYNIGSVIYVFKDNKTLEKVSLNDIDLPSNIMPEKLEFKDTRTAKRKEADEKKFKLAEHYGVTFNRVNSSFLFIDNMYRIKLADGSEIKVKYEDVFPDQIEDNGADENKVTEENKNTEESKTSQEGKEPEKNKEPEEGKESEENKEPEKNKENNGENKKKGLEGLESLFGIN